MKLRQERRRFGKENEFLRLDLEEAIFCFEWIVVGFGFGLGGVLNFYSKRVNSAVAGM